MNFTNQELKTLALPLLACLVLLGAGAALIVWTQQEQRASVRELAAAREQRAQARERLMRIAEEEKEVKAKLEVYLRLRDLGILGDERRLEWADAMTRIRTQRELPDLRDSGNAYYSVKQCSLLRTGAAPTVAGLAPRLRAECEIDLITIIDRAAKT